MRRHHVLLSMAIALAIAMLMPLSGQTWGLAQEPHQHDDRDHGKDEHDKHDDHEGHEGHDDHDEGVIRLDGATMREFGIELREAATGSLSTALRLPGEVVFNADRIAHVAPVVAGMVRQVEVSVGDRVQSGQVLATLSSRELATARSEYLAAEARLALQREALAREERLQADRLGTDRQVLEARQAVREAQIALNLAEQHLHALGEDHQSIAALPQADDAAIGEYRLRAPLDGVVIARELTRGEVLGDQPQHDQPFIVADLSTVWVNLTVYPRDLPLVRPGLNVTLSFGHGIPDAAGQIAFVSPALDEHTRTATARVVLANPDGHWRPGLFVTASAAINQAAVGIVVPRSAVQQIDDHPVVFVQTAKGLEPRPVKLGRSSDEGLEIIKGLQAGERYAAGNTLSLKAELNRAALEHAGHVH